MEFNLIYSILGLDIFFYPIFEV